MTVRPIIFSGPMVRRLIALGKTQTRRLATSPLRKVQPGDRLYVREKWQLHSRASDLCTVVYGASENLSWTEFHGQFPDVNAEGMSPKPFQEGWRSSLHMPRWASRITLEVTAVRVEPLQAISHEDCVAEGVEPLGGDGPNFYTVNLPNGWNYSQPTPRPCYETLWRELHGQGSWDANPDVLVVSFTPIAGNVDQLVA